MWGKSPHTGFRRPRRSGSGNRGDPPGAVHAEPSPFYLFSFAHDLLRPDPTVTGTATLVSPAELESYLHDHIPLTAAMGVSVDRAEQDRIVLRAPLEPNINHRKTVFGGSASALAILAGWALVHVRMRRLGHSPGRIVIQRNQMEYRRPIEGEFTAICTGPEPEAWDRFVRILERKGMARIALEVTVEVDGEPAGHLEGAYVVVEEDGD